MFGTSRRDFAEKPEKGSGKGISVIHRVGLNPHGIDIFT